MARIYNKDLTPEQLVDYRKMVLFVKCGVGTKSASAYLVPEGLSQEVIDEYAWESAVEHGQSYGVYLDDERPEDFDEEEQGGESQEEYNTDAINGWFEAYDADEHDGELLFGNFNDFQWTYY
jgi:hypothetical protein